MIFDMSETTTDVATQIETLRASAAEAEAAYRWQDAIAAYERCLGLLGDAPDAAALEPALLTRLGACYWNLAEARAAWRTLRRALTLYEQRGDALGLAGATLEIGRIWGPQDRHRQMAETALHALGDQAPCMRAHLLLRLRWSDEEPNAKFEQAMTLAERHGCEEVLVNRIEQRAWEAFDDSRMDDHVALLGEARAVYRRLGKHEWCIITHREAGLSLTERGRLDDGYAESAAAYELAASMDLRFQQQLALMDMVGVHFARGEYGRCEELLARSPGNQDFRGDLYRMWIALARGDTDEARALIVDPERAGRATTGLSQTFSAAAGVFYTLGSRDAAREAMERWAEQSLQSGYHGLASESPALRECLVELAEEKLVRAVYDAFRDNDARFSLPFVYGAMQGRALAPVRGAVCERLGLREEAARHYGDGLALCERERLPADAALCREGLARAGG
jgi:tetratricopeptide (TPR) repeat protein